MSKLQKFIEIMRPDYEDKVIQECIVNNFENQEASSFELDGETFYVFFEDEVQDILDIEFENELDEAFYYLEENYFSISQVLKKLVFIDHNYKNVKDFYDSLQDYNLIDNEDGIYIYTKY